MISANLFKKNYKVSTQINVNSKDKKVTNCQKIKSSTAKGKCDVINLKRHCQD